MSNILELSKSGSESLWRKAGAVLGVVATTALFISGCSAPKEKTEVTNTAQEQESPTADPQTDSRGNPDLDWRIVDKDCAGGDDCEEGELGGYSYILKACDGTTLLYRYDNSGRKAGVLTAIPNSPECGYTPPTPTSPAPSIEATPTPTNSN